MRGYTNEELAAMSVGRLPKRSTLGRRRALVTRARELRKAPTAAEQRLWEALRDRRLGGHKFLRQRPIRGFIVDFYCAKASLVLEVDGGIHAERETADAERERTLATRGVYVLRVTNEDVVDRIDHTLRRISEVAQSRMQEQE